ncbi:NAD(P)-dependent oxidoreductase [Chelatococcus sambhunathii]|uniref:NAD(P)-dependent oxidoreductase n=1 Tax=Chelatococcus sambhunathii TaxID=363953 RepID=A0ABU1DCM8_9HYPH|nr:NAD(P)-dependent oxidoreductase [Chelatococcus sambhunathii]MDR4305866.1 NAD(P)-dependent oxidoreductase [Chelatococcus sambhunathii]
MIVGFIGVGGMGSGVARRIMAGGHHLKAWNRSRSPLDALAGEGAEVVATPGDAVDADVLVSMLSRDEVIEDVLVGSGALNRARPGLVHANLSTVSVAFAERMERLHTEKGLGYVSAPVLGRPNVAAAGQLNVLASGAPDAVRKATPVLETFAKKVWPLGDKAASASVVKIACNFALASMIETLGEAGALAEAHGVGRAALYEVMTGSLFAAPAYQTYADIIAQKAFEPAGFKLPLGLKDVRLALAAGESKDTPLPIASLLRDGFLEAIAAGDADKDWSALAAGAFRRAGRPLS